MKDKQSKKDFTKGSKKLYPVLAKGFKDKGVKTYQPYLEIGFKFDIDK